MMNSIVFMIEYYHYRIITQGAMGHTMKNTLLHKLYITVIHVCTYIVACLVDGFARTFMID